MKIARGDRRWTDAMILCADDYGLSDGIDEAILELCRCRKLSAVSCMAALERCGTESMARLLVWKPKVDIGLHLCLTDVGLALSDCPAWPGTRPPQLPSFPNLLSRSFRGIDHREMIQTVAAQYDLFLQKCGVRPDFIDGHLYAHQLPRVANAVKAFVLSLPAESRPYVRNTHLPLSELRSRRLPWLKAAFIGVFGRPMSQRLRDAGIRTNRGFAGIYDFKMFGEYPAYLPLFLECLPNPNGILVVHPGHDEDWRKQEMATLREFAFSPGTLNRFES